jgi:threonylcarbamoyladenosine tRNA methylthiotransferase MtaB
MSNETGPGGPKAPRVSFWTLGCRLNQHDTAAMRGDLARAGYAAVRPGEEPDVVVVNTCTVTARADQEARQLIRRLAREHPRARLVVTGCYAQRAPAEVAALPGVTRVLGTAERDRITAELGSPAGIAVAPARARRELPEAAPVAFGRTRALLKVQDGCDSFCAYCIVPYVRGRSRSLPIPAALDQARRLLGAGFHELVVTGADLGAYGRDLDGEKGGHLPRLVEALLELSGAHRVRLSSIEPHKVDPALVSLLGAQPRLCRHLHLPLQSGSASVLRAMRRPYTPRDYVDLIERIAARGTVAIGSDVIVGFPGEEERHFEETLRLIERLPLTYLHVFRYSPRPGTRAAEAPSGALPSAAAARERSERLRSLGVAKQRAFLRDLVGSELDAVLERPDRTGVAHAMTDVYAPVRLSGQPAMRGRFRVRVESLENGVLAGAVAAARAG